MKALFLIVSLLVNLFFYGQNKADNKPIILEGYIVDSCFYEKKSDKIWGREGIEYSSSIKNIHLLKILDTTKNMHKGIYVKFEAVRASKKRDEKPCICDTKVLVNEILEMDTSRGVITDIQSYEDPIPYGKEEYIEVDGFFVNEFEGERFHEKKGDSLLKGVYTIISKDFDQESLFSYAAYGHYRGRGIRIKAKVIKYSEAPWGYGRLHGISTPSMFALSEIIFADTLQTMYDHLLLQLDTKGYALVGDYKYRYPDILEKNRDYKFSWSTRGLDCKLSLKRINNRVVEYDIKAYSVDDKKLEYSYFGKASLDKYFFGTDDYRTFRRINYNDSFNGETLLIDVYEQKNDRDNVEIEFVVWDKNFKLKIASEVVEQEN